jgi:hypothetical protein
MLSKLNRCSSLEDSYSDLPNTAVTMSIIKVVVDMNEQELRESLLVENWQNEQ